ncbi:hypothetical protein DOY81_003310 [Sarcophaga bullata]|nr:hypothetical protein DOY81_003310 [Sarcophaga bullata]
MQFQKFFNASRMKKYAVDGWMIKRKEMQTTNMLVHCDRYRCAVAYVLLQLMQQHMYHKIKGFFFFVVVF